MDIGEVNKGVHPQVALHNLLKENEDITWIRQRTARNATLLNQLADEAWPDLGSPESASARQPVFLVPAASPVLTKLSIFPHWFLCVFMVSFAEFPAFGPAWIRTVQR